MKTKDEIVREFSDDRFNVGFPFGPAGLYKMLDQYAKQTAIDFAAWIDGNGFECELHTDENVKFWAVKDGEPYLTTSQLYDLFLTTLY